METINWPYVFSTLIIRFVGVFIVLGILQISIRISGAVIKRLFPESGGDAFRKH